jgi:hypothetical protein
VKIDERTNLKAYKKSYETQIKRTELDKEEMDSLPSNYNTKMGTGARYTNNKLL